MNKKFRLLFIFTGVVGLIVILIIIFSSISTENDNYKMSPDSLVNSLREDTSNYQAVNKGREDVYKGKTFTINGQVDYYDNDAKLIMFNTYMLSVIGYFDKEKLKKKDIDELKKIKKGFSAEITGKFDKKGNNVFINEAKLNRLSDDNFKVLVENEKK